LSFRGLDNASYYRLPPDDPSCYADDAGCGNVLALDRPHVVRLAMDALRAWAELGGVHGFRFDLAPVLGRRPDGFDPAAPLLTAISQDPVLRELKLIAEPWDVGTGGYKVGAFPGGWGEWNDRFRDDARGFWRGDAMGLGEIATRLAGSADLFTRKGRPSRCVNFIVAHDGFTLADLVSYEHKVNEANGEHNRDGTDQNRSWNNGVEGPPTIRVSVPSAPPTSARCWRCFCCRGARRCWLWGRNSATARAETTTPMPRITISPGSTGARPTHPCAIGPRG
jgi:glycogen operon protein